MFDQIGGNFQSLVTLINNTINSSYFTYINSFGYFSVQMALSA